MVTGAAGFIPSFLVDTLVKRGAVVTAIDNLKAGKLENLKGSRPHIRFEKTDVRDVSAVNKLMNGQEVVFHLAANADVPESVRDPKYDFETNALGTFNVLTSALEAGVHKVIYASSAAVYGEPKYTPIDEQHPLQPISPYGASKLAGESLGFAFHKTYGLDFVSVRIFNTYGPRQPRYVMFDFMRKLLNTTGTFEVLGTGNQVRDYCYVEDTAEVFALVAETDGLAGEAFNIAGGNPISIKELAEQMVRDLGLENKVRIVYTGKSWQGDITKLIADITKIRQRFDFRPRVGFSEGLRRLESWYQTERARGRRR